MAWTDERIELLTKHWADGLSARQIASRLGGGITRNAVVGKASRMGLPARAPRGEERRKHIASQTLGRTYNAQRKKPQPKTRTNLAPEPFTPVVEPFIPPEERKSLLDLQDHDCRWPIGHGPYEFCARKKEPGVPYCKDHARMAYVPPQMRGRQFGTPTSTLTLPKGVGAGPGAGLANVNATMLDFEELAKV